MILRVLNGAVPRDRASRFSARLRDELLLGTSRIDGIVAATFGIRDEVDHWAIAAISVWRDEAAIAAAGGSGAPSRAFAALRDVAAFDPPMHYELGDDSVKGVEWQPGAIGIVRVRVDSAARPSAETLVRRQQEHLLATGDVRALLVGARSVENATEIAAVAIWRDRDLMRTFLAERPEGPGIDPRFVELTRDLRFETFDIPDAAEPLPAPGAPAVLVLDIGRVFVDASPGVEPLLGMPAELLLGRRLDDFLDADAAAGADDRWRSFLRSGSDDGQLTFALPTGSPVRLRYQAGANLPDPGLHAWLLHAVGDPPSPDPRRTIRAALERGSAGNQLPSVPRATPTIVCVPSRDRLFHRFVVATLDSLQTPSARRLQLHLRGLYPHAVVHRRELEREPASTWYVFRDRLLGGFGLEEDWWMRPEAASVSVHRDGRVVDFSGDTDSVFGGDSRRLAGRDVRRQGIPGSFDDLALLLRLVFEEGVVESTIRLLHADGRPVDLVIRGEADASIARFSVAPLPDQGEPAEWFAPICFPTSDELFIARVEELSARLAPGNAAVRAAQLATRLRRFYPNAVVRSLGHVIGFGNGTHVLFVYRDGDRRPHADEPWWESPGTARIAIAEGRYVEANDEALELYGLTQDELFETRPGDLVGGQVDGVWLADILNRTGVLESTASLRRADGSAIEMEYRATADKAAPGRLLVAIRPVASSGDGRDESGEGEDAGEAGDAGEAAGAEAGDPDVGDGRGSAVTAPSADDPAKVEVRDAGGEKQSTSRDAAHERLIV